MRVSEDGGFIAGSAWRLDGVRNALLGLGPSIGPRIFLWLSYLSLKAEPISSAAWGNFGIACWYAGRGDQAILALERALTITPGLEPAALRLSAILRSRADYPRAASVIANALAHNSQSWRLSLEDAELARLVVQPERTRCSVLTALAIQSGSLDPGQPGTSGLRPPAGTDLRSTLQRVCVRLDELGEPYHLMAGTLLAIVKDGELFRHDKDVDLALPDLDDAGCERILAGFAQDKQFRLLPAVRDGDGRITVVCGTDTTTGLGFDLMFPRRQANGAVLNRIGWPNFLATLFRPYGIGSHFWAGQHWPVPVPTAQYLEDLYGADWQEQVCTEAGVLYDRCFSDTLVCNPSRTPDTQSLAIDMGLIRLVHALDERAWSKSVAYCAQLLHRERLPEVEVILKQLQAAGHEGMRGRF